MPESDGKLCLGLPDWFLTEQTKSKAAVSGLHPKEEMRMLSSVFAGLQM